MNMVFAQNKMQPRTNGKRSRSRDGSDGNDGPLPAPTVHSQQEIINALRRELVVKDSIIGTLRRDLAPTASP